MIKPRSLRPGDTLGVFTPSSPGYVSNPGLFENGLRNLEKLGFKIKLGRVTAARSQQGYRSAPAPERAAEFMELIEDSEVRGLISTIGGTNSNSLIPYLDFQKIAQTRKVICGFSDVTSLHLAIAKHSGLVTFYGPSVMCWFGEWPDGIPESERSFMAAVTGEGERHLPCPTRWSNHGRRWDNGDWQNVARAWQPHPGWRVLNPGEVTAEIVPANLNTLMSAAGTDYFPDLKDRILLIEDMDAPQARTERHLRQLSLMGVFEHIAGLIIGKPERYDQQGAPFDYDDLIREVVGSRTYPIVSAFDCSHTVPMLTVPRHIKCHVHASDQVEVRLLESACETY